jgi:hypothetical protein
MEQEKELKGKEYVEWAKLHPDEHNAKMRAQAEAMEKDGQLDAAGSKTLETLLAAKGKTTETVRLFDKVDVLVCSTMDGETEKMAMRVYEQSVRLSKDGNADYMMVIKEMCDVCAKMCVEEPFNTPIFWEQYYERTGSAYLMEVLYTLMEPHERSIEKIKSFRQNRPGPKPGRTV